MGHWKSHCFPRPKPISPTSRPSPNCHQPPRNPRPQKAAPPLKLQQNFPRISRKPTSPQPPAAVFPCPISRTADTKPHPPARAETAQTIQRHRLKRTKTIPSKRHHSRPAPSNAPSSMVERGQKAGSSTTRLNKAANSSPRVRADARLRAFSSGSRVLPMPDRHGQSPKSPKSAAPATASARRVWGHYFSKGHQHTTFPENGLTPSPIERNPPYSPVRLRRWHKTRNPIQGKKPCGPRRPLQ